MGWTWKKAIKDIGIVAEHAVKVYVTQQAIAAVGSLLFDTADEGEEGLTTDPLVELHEDYEKASAVLEQKTQILEPPSASFVSPSVKGLMSHAKRLTAVWMDPIAVIDKAPQTYDMYRDLSSFLSLSGVPSTMEVTPGHTEDTAAMISQAIFANAPVSFLDLADDADPIKVIPFTVTNHNQGCIVQVKHAYYDIPLNTRSPTGAWHSSINIRMTTTEDFRKAQASKFNSASITAPNNRADLELSWISTVKIDWATRPAAEEASQAFPRIFSESLKDSFLIELNSVVGGDQLLKIKGPTGVSPAEIKASVTDIVRKILEKASSPSKLLALPAITITQSDLDSNN